MTRVKRYLKLYLASLRICLAREMIFRTHFLVDAFTQFIWLSLSIFFLTVLYFHSGPIVGWGIEELAVLVGTARIISGLLETVFNHIRRFSYIVNRGELDFFLLRPANSQFLVSTRIFSIRGLVESFFGLVLVVVALQRLGWTFVWSQVFFYLILVITGLLMSYSVWLTSVLPVLWTGRLHNIHRLFMPFQKLTRVPIGIFRGGLKAILTVVVPIAFMGTIPAQALLGQSQFVWISGAIGLTAFFLFSSSKLWKVALKRYGSASS